MDGFSELGLPTLRNESWRYTNLKCLGDVNWNMATKDCEVGDLSWLSQNETHRVVMVNGKFNLLSNHISLQIKVARVIVQL